MAKAIKLKVGTTEKILAAADSSGKALGDSTATVGAETTDKFATVTASVASLFSGIANAINGLITRCQNIEKIETWSATAGGVNFTAYRRGGTVQIRWDGTMVPVTDGQQIVQVGERFKPYANTFFNTRLGGDRDPMKQCGINTDGYFSFSGTAGTTGGAYMLGGGCYIAKN